MGRPILKVAAPPLTIGISALAAKQTRADVISSPLADQARELGVPEAAIQTAGAVAGATEFLPITPTDVISGVSAVSESTAESRAGLPSRGRNVPRTAPPQQSTQVNIPDPVAPKPQMAAQGFVPVPEARANAMQGQETTMKESEVPSFLYGGIVR